MAGGEGATDLRRWVQSDWFKVTIGVLFVGGFLAFVILRDPDTSVATRSIVFTVLAVVALITISIALRILSRRFETVARWVHAVALVAVVLLAGIVPVLVLGAEEQTFALKIGAILILSMIPGFIYLQFLSVRGRTLRDEYLRNLVRLGFLPEMRLAEDENGPLSSDQITDPELRFYLHKFEAVYGPPHRSPLPDEQPAEPSPAGPPIARTRAARKGSDKGGRGRARGETLAPMLWLTVIVSVGWALMLQPERLWDLLPLEVTITGRPELVGDALRFAFLGAYWYVVQMLVRRYFQDDLKADAYLNALVRVLSAVFIVVVVSVIWPSGWGADTLNAFAFLVGIFPQIGIDLIRNTVQRWFRGVVPSLHVNYPLADLDGLNIFYEARLLEEGVEDMQNLASADLLDLMLRTRVPVGRLLDWIDQSHLLLRLPSPRLDDSTGKADRNKLRQFGIRSATGLQDAYDGVQGYEETDNPFLTSLDALLETEGEGASRTRTMLVTLSNEPNLRYVRSWRDNTPERSASSQRSTVLAGLDAIPTANPRAPSSELAPAQRDHVESVAETVDSFVGEHGSRQLDSGSVEGLYMLALNFRALGQHDRAIEYFELASSADPSDPEPLNEAGVTAAAFVKDYDRARRFYERALAIDPGSARVRYNQACLLAREQRYEEALTKLEAVLTENDDLVDVARTDAEPPDGPFAPLADDERFRRLIEPADDGAEPADDEDEPDADPVPVG